MHLFVIIKFFPEVLQLTSAYIPPDIYFLNISTYHYGTLGRGEGEEQTPNMGVIS